MKKIILLLVILSFTGIVQAQQTNNTISSKTGEQKVIFPRTNVMAETAKGKEIGIGSARVISPEQLKVNSMNTVKLQYTAGKVGIKPGGGVRFTFMHMLRWTSFQTDSPDAHSYTTVLSSNGSPVKVTSFINRPWSEIIPSEYMDKYDPYYNVFEVKVTGKGLQEGETIDIVIGDKTQGSPGVLVQYFDEHPLTIETYVDPIGDNNYFPMEVNPTIKIVADKPEKLTVVIASNAVAGEPFWCMVGAEDKYGNVADSYVGKIKIRIEKEAGSLKKYVFGASDIGVHRFDDLILKDPGTYRLILSDGEMEEAVSNPIVVTEEEAALNIYWGDLHNHTKSSDGRGTTAQSYKYARDVSGLDFCSITDHCENQRTEEWEEYKGITKEFNNPGRFVTIPGYEWSGSTANGGDHNVFFMEDNPPIYRSRGNFNYYNYNNYQGRELQVNHIEDLYIRLSKHYTNKNIIVIPHYGGRKANKNWHNPTLERLIEVYSDHKRSEAWSQEFLEQGWKLGIMASSDNHTGKPGNSITFPKTSKDPFKIDWKKEEIGTGLIAVYAGNLQRKDIFEGMYDRHCYATSGDRILLGFRVDGEVMGSEITSVGAPKIKVDVAGTDIITKIEIKKNNQVVKEFFPGTLEFDVTWTDENFKEGEPCFYYVRVEQDNNEEAISSPVWVNIN